MPGKRPQFNNFAKGTHAYDTDYNNFAPNVGFAWTLSDEAAFSARSSATKRSFAAATRAPSTATGMNDFSGQYGANPGVTIQDPDRSLNNGNLNNDGAGLPVLFRQSGRLGPAPFPSSPVYPLTDVVTEDINLFDPRITVPVRRYVDGRHPARGRHVTSPSRRVTSARGRARTGRRSTTTRRTSSRTASSTSSASRRRTCAPTSPPAAAARSPTPARPERRRCRSIFAFFQGATGDENNPASYTSTNFTNNTFLTPLATYNPNPIGFANSLYGDATRRTSAAAAGIPANFFLANPDLQGGADLTTNVGSAPTTTACSSSCAVAMPRACSSRPATPSARR